MLDHVNGDGSKHRQELKTESIYDWLFLHDYPEHIKLRVLCCNCNHARGVYGYCPHEHERLG